MSNVGVCACVCECKCDCLPLLLLVGLCGYEGCSVFDFFICGTTKRLKNKRDEKENHKSAGGG